MRKNQVKAVIAACVFFVALFGIHKSIAVVSNQNTKTVSALGNGTTTNYTIGLTFQDNDDVQVYLQTESTSPYTRTLLVYGAGSGKYTITGGDPGTTVVMGTAPTTSQRIIIQRIQAFTQTVDYDENSAFPAEDHEEQMDKQVLLLQQLNSSLNSKVGLSTVSTQTVPTFPDPVADRLIVYNHDASDLTYAPAAGTTITNGDILKYNGTAWEAYNLDLAMIALTGVSSYMATLLDDTTAAAARTTLGFGASGTFIVSGDLGTSSVTTTKIYDANVTRAKLATGAVGPVVTTAVTSSITATSSQDVFICTPSSSTPVVIALPLASDVPGKTYELKKTDATFRLCAMGNGTSLVDGESAHGVSTEGESLKVVSDGSTYHVVQHYIPSVWKTYTMTIGAVTTAPTKGTMATDIAQWRRVGSNLEIMYNYRHTAAGGAGSGIYLFPIPTLTGGVSILIDTAKTADALSAPSAIQGAVGVVGESGYADGTSALSGTANVWSTTNLALAVATTNGASSVNLLFINSSNGQLSVSNTLAISFRASVPINGWNIY